MEQRIGSNGHGNWVRRPKSTAPARVRLFCFPYAGGSSSIFNGWERHLGKHVELYQVLLPGRGVRLAEPKITDIGEMIRALAEGLEPHLQGPFAFFGHSMGALLAHELTRHLQTLGKPLPQLLAVSARQAPHLVSKLSPTRGSSDAQFMKLLGAMSAETTRLLADASLRRVVLPILRADFDLCESWCADAVSPLEVPIMAFAGALDSSVSVSMIDQWRLHTCSRFTISVLPGDHFFMHAFAKEICGTIEGHFDARWQDAPSSGAHVANVAGDRG